MPPHQKCHAIVGKEVGEGEGRGGANRLQVQLWSDCMMGVSHVRQSRTTRPSFIKLSFGPLQNGICLDFSSGLSSLTSSPGRPGLFFERARRRQAPVTGEVACRHGIEGQISGMNEQILGQGQTYLSDVGLKVMWEKQRTSTFSHRRRVKRLSLIRSANLRPWSLVAGASLFR
jgi:hypothetical protein